MKRFYKIAKHNSTVNGNPGRWYDWSKFDWESKTSCDFGNARYSTESEYVEPKLRGQLKGENDGNDD